MEPLEEIHTARAGNWVISIEASCLANFLTACGLPHDPHAKLMDFSKLRCDLRTPYKGCEDLRA